MNFSKFGFYYDDDLEAWPCAFGIGFQVYNLLKERSTIGSEPLPAP